MTVDIENRLQEVINAETITLVSKRPPHWNVFGAMDYLLGTTLLVKNIEVDVSWEESSDPWVFIVKPRKASGYDLWRFLKLSDIVDYSSKGIKIQGKHYLC